MADFVKLIITIKMSDIVNYRDTNCRHYKYSVIATKVVNICFTGLYFRTAIRISDPMYCFCTYKAN